MAHMKKDLRKLIEILGVGKIKTLAHEFTSNNTMPVKWIKDAELPGGAFISPAIIDLSIGERGMNIELNPPWPDVIREKLSNEVIMNTDCIVDYEYHPFILSLIKNHEQTIYLEYYNKYFSELDSQREALKRSENYRIESAINSAVTRFDDNMVESAMLYYSKLFTRALANYFCSMLISDINLIFNYAASAYAAYSVLQSRKVTPFYPADMLDVVHFHASILSSSLIKS